jgi:hypothetical protein
MGRGARGREVRGERREAKGWRFDAGDFRLGGRGEYGGTHLLAGGGQGARAGPVV